MENGKTRFFIECWPAFAKLISPRVPFLFVSVVRKYSKLVTFSENLLAIFMFPFVLHSSDEIWAVSTSAQLAVRRRTLHTSLQVQGPKQYIFLSHAITGFHALYSRP